MVLSPAQKLRPAISSTPWTLDEVAGRFVEISGAAASAALTLTFTLIREAQARGEPVGWVTLAEHSFIRRMSLKAAPIWRRWWWCV